VYFVIYTSKGTYFKMKDNILIDRNGNELRPLNLEDEIKGK